MRPDGIFYGSIAAVLVLFAVFVAPMYLRRIDARDITSNALATDPIKAALGHDPRFAHITVEVCCGGTLVALGGEVASKQDLYDARWLAWGAVGNGGGRVRGIFMTARSGNAVVVPESADAWEQAKRLLR